MSDDKPATLRVVDSDEASVRKWLSVFMAATGGHVGTKMMDHLIGITEDITKRGNPLMEATWEDPHEA